MLMFCSVGDVNVLLIDFATFTIVAYNVLQTVYSSSNCSPKFVNNPRK